MKYLIILTLILFVCDISAAEEGKSENLIAVTIDFREKQPPNIVELKSELINNGFDWSSVFAYILQKNRIVFVARESSEGKTNLVKSEGAASLYLLLGKLRAKYGYELEPLGSFVTVRSPKRGNVPQ